MGYKLRDIEQAQARWNLKFPPDLVELLLQRRPLLSGPSQIDWVSSPAAFIRERIDWPFESFWFDVTNGVWWPEWGAKPRTEEAQRARLREIFAAAPKLIPLYGHRYLPAEPNESGNPVFSVYQTDVVIYGANLKDWLSHEAGIGRAKGQHWNAPKTTKNIRFWSAVVASNS